MNDRIKKIREYFCGDSNIAFAKKMGERPNTVNNWISRSVKLDVAEKILKKFPQVNPGWLITGEGEMLKPTIIGVAGNISGNGQEILVSSNKTVTNNITLPEKGTVKIIKPDGEVNIMSENFIDEALERIKELEMQLRQCERDLSDAKDKIIKLLEKNKE